MCTEKTPVSPRAIVGISKELYGLLSFIEDELPQASTSSILAPKRAKYLKARKSAVVIVARSILLADLKVSYIQAVFAYLL